MNLHREILITSTLLGSWLGMQGVHELGHVCGAWLTGGQVEQVVLHPLTISRTDLAKNPAPLTVVWAGPLCGVSLPIALWLSAVATQMPGSFILRFFVGFCLVANGLYIGLGSLGRIGTVARCSATAHNFGTFGSSGRSPFPWESGSGTARERNLDSGNLRRRSVQPSRT